MKYLNIVFVVAVIFTINSCASKTNSDNTINTSIKEEIIYEIHDEPLISKLSDNPPWNFQQLYPLGPGVTLNSGDKIRIEASAMSDRDISLLQSFIVDQIDGFGWKVMSGYYPVAERITEGTLFNFTKEMRITTSSLGDSIRVALFSEYDHVETDPNITFMKFKVTRIHK